MRSLRLAVSLTALLAIAACGDAGDAPPPPPPQSVSAQSVGHYCGMALADHAGPKGQIFIQGRPDPVWFSSIKQLFAYTLLPEEPKAVSALYVNDMGTAGPDGKPDPAAWIDARKAFYVIEGRFIGGMGAEDAMPFSQRADAQTFSQTHGGRVVAFSDVPEQYVFAQ
ncbi:nitrous oxide reductase accessory protein NosL [Achromobacter marplatensis]|uniref:nitrous oxide reductase accessory protein NosL n=1 Tax=Achromobacter marplatensis TaxID=470868 RepID=UPI0039F6F734